jgi:hypothetical protein
METISFEIARELSGLTLADDLSKWIAGIPKNDTRTIPIIPTVHYAFYAQTGAVGGYFFEIRGRWRTSPASRWATPRGEVGPGAGIYHDHPRMCVIVTCWGVDLQGNDHLLKGYWAASDVVSTHILNDYKQTGFPILKLGIGVNDDRVDDNESDPADPMRVILTSTPSGPHP